MDILHDWILRLFNADEEEEEALDLAYTLMTYGSMLGAFWVVILFGSGVILLGTGIIPDSILILFVFAVVFGWMGLLVAVGGAVYAVHQHAHVE